MKEKVILGISLGFNSSAAIISENHGVLCCVSQERLNRQKNTKQLPLDAIVACIDVATKKLGHSIVVTDIAYSHYEGLSDAYLLKNVPEEWKVDLEAKLQVAKKLNTDCEWAFLRLIKDFVTNNASGIIEADHLDRIEHHTAHAYSAFPVYSDYSDTDIKITTANEFYSLTADGFGDGFSGKITKYTGNNCEEVISQVRVIDSPALVYQFFTGALQFKEHQHEGKVTGLAAHCEANPERALEVYHDLMFTLTGKKDVRRYSPLYKTEFLSGKAYDYSSTGFWVDDSRLMSLTQEQEEMVKTSTIVDFERFLKLKNTVYQFVTERLGKDYNKDDILDYLQGKKKLPKSMKYTPWEMAYAVQYFAERVILNWVHGVFGTKNIDRDLYMAGGLVANVKLNQRIKDSGIFNRIFVSPPMGDEGTALGCAYKLFTEIGEKNISDWDEWGHGPNIIIEGGTPIEYPGTQFPSNSMDAIIDEAFQLPNLEVTYFKDKNDLIDVVTDLLADNKIVHWCQNAEEFGPRALMNHSTLYTAEDPNGTHTLNQAMGRSEYMPYCPVCKNTSADELFENWQPGEASCRFMAMTMNCKPGVAEKYRGGVHVDNTARAQFIYEHNTYTDDAWNILDSYELKTGNKMLINTSFNIHNTPTCNLANDCWHAWKESGRVGAALVLGNYLFLNTDSTNK